MNYLWNRLIRINVWKSTLLTLFVLSPWFAYLFTLPDSHLTAVLWAYTAVILYLLAFILYVFLQTISHMGKSVIRKKLVTFTRVYIRFHIATALLGFFSLIIHVDYMISKGWIYTRVGASGLLASSALLAVLFTGLLRKKKSSGKRRRIHRYTAYTLLILIGVHLYLS